MHWKTIKMKKSFILQKVSFYIENDVMVFSFADSLEDEPENYVILSRTQFPGDNEDFGAHIECSFGINGYNLISDFSITEEKIVLFIKHQTIDKIEIITHDIYADLSLIKSIIF